MKRTQKWKYITTQKGSRISNLTKVYGPICNRECLDECQLKYYQYDIERKPKGVRDFYPPIIEIRHSNLPDIIIKHIPQTTLISFVCSFGGLLGMWLGLSFITISREAINLIIKIASKKLKFVTMVNINMKDSIFIRNEFAQSNQQKSQWNHGIFLQDLWIFKLSIHCMIDHFN